MNADRREIRAEMDKMNELLYREEMLWLQRSRIQWLKEGDRNTQMFHRKAVWRARKNRIKSLTDEQGVVHTEQHMMLQLGNTYFQNLFSANPLLDPGDVLQLIQPKVSSAMNNELCREFRDFQCYVPNRAVESARTRWFSSEIFSATLGGVQD